VIDVVRCQASGTSDVQAALRGAGQGLSVADGGGWVARLERVRLVVTSVWALVCLGLGGAWSGWAQVAPGTVPKVPEGLELVRWAREPMLRSPVALAFDPRGRLYVVETARRSTVDIDIRAHPSWIVDDLANQSVDDLRRFFRTKMSTENSLENAGWLQDRNGDGIHDWQDLTTVTEKVHVLEDSQGVGRADRARVFAEGFNEEINGVIAGVLPWGEDVFVTIYPDLWRLRDTDGDGVADVKESVFRGFGVHAAFDGHDLHGLTVGPDGKIYFSVGDNGFSVTSREGYRWHYPNTGGVLRMNPDGSDLEVYATGLRNPQEIAFDTWGDLFTVDNDGDLAEERERFVYIAEGSDSGWRLHWQFREAGWARYTGQPNYNPWIDERQWVPHFPGQPAHITPPLSNYSVGPGSFRFNPGTALNEAYRDHFFLIQFPVAKVTAFRVQPKGAGFEMVGEHALVTGMMASALNFGPDGALYLGDWDGMWSPSGKGSIWKVDDPGAAKSAMRAEVRDRLREGARSRTLAELEGDLGHADMRVRQQAQFECVRRREFGVLKRVARSTQAPLLARVHALWGLGQGVAVTSAADLPWRDDEAELRAQAAKVAGDLGLPDAVGALMALTRDPEPRVRYHAALALGKVGNGGGFDAIAGMLAENGDRDPFLRHAGVMAWAGMGDTERLAGLVSHESPAVRLASVVALRRLHSGRVSRFLDDPDPGVGREAVRAIHDDDSIPDALPALAGLMERRGWVEEPGMMRRILNANLRLGTDESSRRLAAYASRSNAPSELRLEALLCLADWAREPALDRVQGFVRPLGSREKDLGDRRIREGFDGWEQGADKDFLQALVRVVLDHRISVNPQVFVDGCRSGDQPASVRARVLELLAAQHPERLVDVLPASLDVSDRELREISRRVLAKQDPEAYWDRALKEFPNAPTHERQWTLGIAGAMSNDRARRWVEGMLGEALAGRVEAGLVLDVREAAGARPEAEIRARVAAWVRSPKELEVGGDPVRGREIFRSHPNAQCVRCHEAGGAGQQVGPVLQGIAGRVTVSYLVESLLEPSARIADGFATVSVEMGNGDVWDGIRLEENDRELTLRLGTGVVRKISRKDVVRQTASTVSSMPPMGEVLSWRELRDLVAYLSGLK